MLDWFRRVFLGYRDIVTLAERHEKASAIGAAALATFDGIVADLREAADELRAVAQEAKAEAEALVARGNDATAEAAKHEARADKIASLVD